MKIFGWMQKKLNGSSKKLNPISVNHPSRKETEKEEFSDWPDGLLAIGTFGNNAATEEDFVQYNLEEFTPEEVEKLQNLLLHKQDGSISYNNNNNKKKLVNGDPSLEDDRSNNSLVVGRGKGIYNVDNTINKRSLSFLLNKLFVCRGGFSPTPTLRDQIPESTMEKILIAILHKKIYPQNQTSTSSTNKYLKNNHKDDDNGSKWVKTDSEYIVLEI